MLNISKILFLTTMILGTIMVISSETWLGIWMGLEINMLSFVPVMYTFKNPRSAEGCMIYFLIQSIGSILMLMLILSNSLLVMYHLIVNELLNMMLMFSIMIKLGMPPFHFWFPEIMVKMSWSNCAILMTWQKIAPMMVLMQLVPNCQQMTLIIIMATIIGAIGGLNQTAVKKIMAYSSINHMGWIVACMKFNNILWIEYILIYSVILIMMIVMFSFYSISYINQMSLNSGYMEKTLIAILFLSLGGMPPFLGFLPKWMVIQTMMMSNTLFTLTIMVLSSLITLFYYLRMISTNFMINSPTWKWNLTTKPSPYISAFMILINMSLPVVMTLSF
uniref:NADH-ubiquinone oxidoreductase chain 2 n=1 Tax=Sirthenea flavipes TaxID=941641 RepID=L7N9L6_9HEMI|nr:NADH dehydrogenase subunit 2 [Sirthenea flavipes]ADU58097.1 NADH dehydrogenase subunit 2 [Sirthenea flavipes]